MRIRVLVHRQPDGEFAPDEDFIYNLAVPYRF
jgi:hypothetical protein